MKKIIFLLTAILLIVVAGQTRGSTQIQNENNCVQQVQVNLDQNDFAGEIIIQEASEMQSQVVIVNCGHKESTINNSKTTSRIQVIDNPLKMLMEKRYQQQKLNETIYVITNSTNLLFKKSIKQQQNSNYLNSNLMQADPRSGNGATMALKLPMNSNSTTIIMTWTSEMANLLEDISPQRNSSSNSSAKNLDQIYSAEMNLN